MRRAVAAMTALAAAGLLGAACASEDGAALSDPRAEAGRTLYRGLGCAGCHGRAGQGGSGPELRGLAGSQVELADGRRVTADDAYLRRAVRDPGADIAKGYGNAMTRIRVTDDQLAQLLAYLRTL